MEPHQDRSLIPRPSHELALPRTLRSRILGEIVDRSLALAREATSAIVDLDALVREGKRMQCGEGMTPGNIQAFKLLHKAAIAGHAEAQFLVSECYYYGCGIELDRAQYTEWLRKSAESGFAAAQNRFGFEKAQDHVEAIRWFRMAAEQNNSKGQLNLGNAYRYGHGVAQDPVEAAKWYRKAANLGNAKGQCLLASAFKNGLGVAQDDKEAAKWWEKAAKQGDEGAQYHLGTRYAEGRGLSQSDEEAFKWWKKSAEQGGRLALYQVGSCYARGTGVRRDIVEAYRWFRLAAEHAVGKKVKEDAKAEAAALEALMLPSEIEAGLALCRKFDDKERSRLPRWMFEGIDEARRPLNQPRS